MSMLDNDGSKNMSGAGQRGSRPTLGLDKDALVNTGLEGTVEEGVELGVGVGAELVVGLDVLLQALAAVIDKVIVSGDARSSRPVSLPKSESR